MPLSNEAIRAEVEAVAHAYHVAQATLARLGEKLTHAVRRLEEHLGVEEGEIHALDGDEKPPGPPPPP